MFYRNILGLDSPFLQQVLQEPWKLSTSQVNELNFCLLFITKEIYLFKTPTTYDEKRFQRLLADNPDLAVRYGINGQQNLAPGGGGFGPVRIIDISNFIIVACLYYMFAKYTFFFCCHITNKQSFRMNINKLLMSGERYYIYGG